MKKIPNIIIGKEQREIEKKDQQQVEVERQLGPGKYNWDKKPKKIPPRPFIRPATTELQRPTYLKTNGPDQFYTIKQKQIGTEGKHWKVHQIEPKTDIYLKNQQSKQQPPDCGTYNPNLDYTTKYHQTQPIKISKKLNDTDLKEALMKPTPFHYTQTSLMIYPHPIQKQEGLSKKSKQYLDPQRQRTHTYKELIQNKAPAPKYGFGNFIRTDDHGEIINPSSHQKDINQNVIKQQQQTEIENKKRKQFSIPKMKRKPVPQIWMDRDVPKFGFATYQKGKSKIKIL